MKIDRVRERESEAGTTAIQYGVMASGIIAIIVVAKGILGSAIIDLVSSIAT